MRIALTLMSLVLAAPAFAGGVADPVQPPVRISPPADVSWTGYYYGANALYGMGTPTGTGDISGPQFGLVVGGRVDFGDFVVGVEVEHTQGNIGLSGSTARNLSRLFNVGVELGYDAGDFLPYATVGMSGARFIEPVILPNFDASGLGVFYGIGVDYRLSDTVTVGAEVVQHRFTDFPLPNTDLDLNTFSLTAAYRF